ERFRPSTVLPYRPLFGPGGPCRMKSLRVALTLVVLAAVAVVTWSSVPVGAQAPTTIKIGLLYDHTGPFAAGGSLNCWRGAKMMIDYINEKGGVLGQHKLGQARGHAPSTV